MSYCINRKSQQNVTFSCEAVVGPQMMAPDSLIEDTLLLGGYSSVENKCAEIKQPGFTKNSGFLDCGLQRLWHYSFLQRSRSPSFSATTSLARELPSLQISLSELGQMRVRQNLLLLSLTSFFQTWRLNPCLSYI